MKKKVLIVLFSVFVAGIYVQAQAQKVNVVSVSKEKDIHNFYTMMKEAFPGSSAFYILRRQQKFYFRCRGICSVIRGL